MYICKHIHTMSISMYLTCNERKIILCIGDAALILCNLIDGPGPRGARGLSTTVGSCPLEVNLLRFRRRHFLRAVGAFEPVVSAQKKR